MKIPSFITYGCLIPYISEYVQIPCQRFKPKSTTMSLFRRAFTLKQLGRIISPTLQTYISRPIPISQPAFYSTSPKLHTTTGVPPSSQTLQITESCKKRLKDILENGTFLRVSVDGGGCSGFQYKFEIDRNIVDEDVVLCGDNPSSAIVVIDKTSLDIIRGSTLDYETELIRAAFRIIHNPQAEQGCSCGSSFNVKLD